jgi:hypothetical protein
MRQRRWKRQERMPVTQRQYTSTWHGTFPDSQESPRPLLG